MFSKKDVLNIAFRQWRGESLKEIAPDYDTTEKDLAKLRKEKRAEFAHLEAEFHKAEIQRLTAEDPVRKAHYGFVIAGYMFAKARAHLPEAIVEFSQQSPKTETHLHTVAEAKQVLESFEADFGITLI